MSASRPGQPSGAFRGAWAWLLLGCAVVATAVEVSLLVLGSGYLTSGYNTTSLTSTAEIAAFLGASLLLDAVLMLLIWIVTVPLLSALRASPLQIFCAAGLAAVVLPIAASAARFNVYSIVGDMFNVALMSRVGSATWSAMALELVAGPRVIWFGAGLIGGLAMIALVVQLGRIERRRAHPIDALRAPGVHRLLAAFAVSVAVALPVLLVSTPTLQRLRYGLRQQPGAAILMSIVHRLSDVDGDGYDAFARPVDSAPWDASIHPYALEQPGNGVDENGIAGDLPADRPLRSEYPPPAPLAARPHVLLLFLESFRADLLERDVDGMPIAPFLRRLAADGASSRHAWAHSPWTLSSRSQLFSGNLVSRPGEPTLIDDFKAWGYAVAYFSGQDETYGDSEAILGTDRADVFYDARQDLARRTSRSTASVSLQVSWKTLLERVEEGLDEVPRDRPLLLYVNIVDTHFPYHHDEIDDRLGVAPLERGEIRAHRAERVFRGYANTARNVDHAAERLVSAWRERIGDADHAILVLSDHGQAFYEEGRLGHGQSLEPAVAQLPWIVWGIGGEWPEPIAPTDVRPMLRRHLGVDRSTGVPRARFVPDPEREILQYVPHARRPSTIAMRGIAGARVYDFEGDRFDWIAPDGTRSPLDRTQPSAGFGPLVHAWETLARAEAAADR